MEIDDAVFGERVINKINNQINGSPINSNILIYSDKKIANSIKKDIDINASASKKNQTLFLYGGKGGEGTVFVSSDSTLAVKIYNRNKSDTQKEQKLKSMVEANVNVHGICWPLKYSIFRDRMFYTMRAARGIDLYLLLRKRTLEKYPHIDRLFLTNIVIDLLNKIIFLHQNDILMGDINLMNIWVDLGKSETYLIDTDSFQFDKYPCPVGSITFTPPELQHQNFSKFLRTKDHEYFAIATLLFMIFHGGKAPYAHVGGSDPAKNIREKNFPYPFGSDFHFETPKGAYENMWVMLPLEMREAFYNVFREGGRKSPEEWKKYVLEYSKKLQNDLPKNIFPASYKTVAGTGSIKRESEVEGIGHPKNIINEHGNGIAIMELSSKAVKLLINKKRDKDFNFKSFYKKAFFTNTGSLLGQSQNMRMFLYKDIVIPRINELKQDAIDMGSKYLYVYAGAVYRAAKNRENLLDMIKNLTDLNVRIIGNKDENDYNYLAQINTIPELINNNICLFDFGAGSFRINLFDSNGKNSWSQKSNFGYESLKKIFFLNNNSDTQTLNAFNAFDKLIIEENEIKKLLNECKKINNIPFQFVGLGGPFTKIGNLSKKSSKQIHKRIIQSNQFESNKIEAQEKLNDRAGKVSELHNRSKTNHHRKEVDNLITVRVSMPIIQKIFKATGKEDIMISGTGLWYGLYYHHIKNNEDETAGTALSCGVY